MLSTDPVIQELGWRLVAKSRMQPFPVVEGLDVLEAGRRHLGTRREAYAMHPLVLEAVEPALRRGVIPAVALAAHRADHAELGELVLKGMTGILASPVGVVHQPRRWFPAEPRHGQRIRHDVRRHAGFQRPAHHFAVEQVEHNGQIQPALVCPQVGDVGGPDLGLALRG